MTKNRGLGFDHSTRRIAKHWIFLSVLCLGVFLRVLAMLGNRPIQWFGGDSDLYVKIAANPFPPGGNPAGYGILLRILRPLHSFAVVSVVQHLLGLATGVLIYAVLTHPPSLSRRRSESSSGAPRWLAALAAAPVLLDAYQIQLEHLVMAESLFIFLITAAIALLGWRAKPSVWQSAAGLFLLALATLTRTVALPVAVIAVAYLILKRVGWRPMLAAVVALVSPLLGYAMWFDAHHGKIGITGADGLYLWSRAATFADCEKLSVPLDEQVLCPNRAPVEVRQTAPAASQWLWNDWSPLRQLPGDASSSETNELARGFALRAITGQPSDYAAAVGRDVMRSFKWNRDPHPGEYTVSYYEFAVEDQPLPTEHSSGSLSVAQLAAEYAPMSATQAVRPYASVIHSYQKFGFVRGPILALILLFGMIGIARKWRTLGGEAILPLLAAVTLLLVPPMVADFDHRYVLPAIPLACLAAALAARHYLHPVNAPLATEESEKSPVRSILDASADLT